MTVAAVGAELTLEQQPNLPVTPEQLARDAAACADAGASIYHLHVRDEHARPTMDPERFRAARAAIQEATELVVQFTTGGAVTDPEEARLAAVDLRPEMATLTTGTVNFGDAVFSNPIPLVSRLYRRMIEAGVLPEYEIFDAGMISSAVRLRAELGAEHHAHFDFVLGVPGGLPAWEDALPFLVRHLPDGATWSATGIGRDHVPVAEQTIALGGHVRTGLEDVLYYRKGELAASNAQLIERVAAMARRAGRAIATPAEARALLGLHPRPAIP
ncbi:MAG: 3-keto-5-aminohexanoate cleavage protein [Actinomycetota bacterium]|nr:3-keto-5-aminohexanoate cleavage protein [Actinomycetota bacterium]